eukprot:gene18083-23731_t
MSIEQYEQLKQLQKIKTKDENGNIIEEKIDEDEDLDTPQLCRGRIKKLVQLNIIAVLIMFLTEGSPQTRECAAASLCQIVVEESIRGNAIQQGVLKACSSAATDETYKKTTRQYAAHTIAKVLVTTNPNVLSDYLRINSIAPLLFLCQDVDSTNLQQFESLLSLTNILSCGDPEIQKFISLKGVSIVHYLVFSEHLMVRRAATEVFCNLKNDEKFLKILRQPDKLRLWLGLCEDWDNSNDPNECYATARAASGTLAMAANDDVVANAMIQEDCSKTLLSLLSSEKSELIYRALVIIITLVETIGKKAAEHLGEGNVIQAIAVVLKINDEDLTQLAKDAAMALNKVMSN